MENNQGNELQRNMGEGSIGHFFEMYEEYINSGNADDVTAFLQELLQNENGLSEEESQQIVDVINESVESIQNQHQEWFDSECRVDEILESVVKQTAEETGVDVRDVYSVLGTLTAKGEVDQLSCAAGENVELAEDFKVDTEDTNRLLNDIASANLRTTQFQIGNTAQGVLDAANEEKKQEKVSKIFKEALASKLFSEAEKKAKTILAVEIYSAVSKKMQEIQDSKEKQAQKNLLPAVAAAESTKAITAAKTVYQMNETPDEDTQRKNELKRYAEIGYVVASKQVLREVVGVVGGYAFAVGAAAFTLITGIPVPLDIAYRAGSCVGKVLTIMETPVKRVITNVAEATKGIARKAVDFIDNVGGKRVVSTLHSVCSAVERGVKTVKDGIKASIAAAKEKVTRGFVKATSWLFGF